jgi:hypothetical protein
LPRNRPGSAIIAQHGCKGRCIELRRATEDEAMKAHALITWMLAILPAAAAICQVSGFS